MTTGQELKPKEDTKPETDITVLLVDDDPGFLDLAPRIFRQIEKSIHIETCQDPLEVLETIENQDIDCVLSDYEMPEVDGVELLERVRDEHPNLPFILVTSKGSEELASEAITAEVTDYVQKDSSRENFKLLANRIQNAVSKENLRKEKKEKDRKLQELYDITADAELSFEDKLQKVFQLGCDFFDMDIGGVAYIDPETNLFEPEYVSHKHEYLTPGNRFRLDETYCKILPSGGEIKVISDPEDEGYTDTKVYQEFGVRTYIGKCIDPEGGRERSFWFVSNETKEKPFTEEEKTFHDMMARWIKHELERKEREKCLKEFTSLVSHDLKNPLTRTEGYLELAAETLEEEDIQKALESIQETKRVLEEVEAIPTTPRELEISELSLEKCFNEACVTGITTPEYEIKDTTVEASRPNLVKMLSKLIENSVDHNENDISIEAGPLENGFYYEDNGKGIDEDTGREVLKRGISIDNGQGLGLYIVKRIVDAHSWKIEVTESENGGARFNFYTS